MNKIDILHMSFKNHEENGYHLSLDLLVKCHTNRVCFVISYENWVES